MSKINSFALVIIMAISLASCSDRSKDLVNTWRVDNVKFSKPRPPQMIAYVQTQVDFMKAFVRTTFKSDGTFEEVVDTHTSKGSWDLSRDGKVVYYTDETGRTTRFIINELTKDKFTYASVNGPEDTLTFYDVPFAAKDTVGRKLPPQMQPRAHSAPQQQEGGAPQQQGEAPQQGKAGPPAASTQTAPNHK
jgi:hypothetical protein